MSPRDEAANVALQQSEERFRILTDELRDQAICMLDPAGHVVGWNSGAERMTGWPEAEILGAPLAVLLGPVENVAAIAARLLEAARRNARIEEDAEHRRKDGTPISVIMTLTTLAGRGGSERGFALVMRDVTESRKAENRQHILAREVDHRTMNALAVVQSILRLSVAVDTPSFIRVVEGRVAALARSHKRIAEQRWEAALLISIIDDELATLDRELRSRIHVTGPVVWLAPTAAQSMALAVHELATNACHHGALVGTNGSVTVQWHRHKVSDPLVLSWIERDGPKTPNVISERFGFAIVRAMIETQLEGAVQIDWSSGLSCRLSVPAHHLATL